MQKAVTIRVTRSRVPTWTGMPYRHGPESRTDMGRITQSRINAAPSGEGQRIGRISGSTTWAVAGSWSQRVMEAGTASLAQNHENRLGDSSSADSIELASSHSREMLFEYRKFKRGAVTLRCRTPTVPLASGRFAEANPFHKRTTETGR